MAFLTTSIMLVLVAASFSVKAYAANAVVKINFSEAQEINGQVVVPVTIAASENIGTYSIILEYDTSRLSYASGAEGSAQGSILLTGTGVSDTIEYTILFNVLSGGGAGIIVRSAVIQLVNSEELFTVRQSGPVTINLSGEDTGDDSFEVKSRIASMSAQTNIPLFGIITMENGEEYFLVDLSTYTPEEMEWNCHKISDKYQGSDITFFTDEEENVRLLYLLGEDRELVCLALDEDEQFYSTEKKVDQNGAVYLGVPLAACRNVAKDIASIEYGDDSIVYGIGKDGTGDFYFSDNWGRIKKWEPGMEDQVKQAYRDRKRVEKHLDVIYGVIFTVLVLLIGGIFFFVFYKQKNERRRRRLNVSNSKKRHQTHPAQVNRRIRGTIENDSFSGQMPEKIVISVQNVSMKFKSSVGNAAGIKDYLIQAATRKVKTKEFTALDNVSFDVLKGEVVGIIGTNGSGKSTLLKIVSGALKPTSGTVRLDKNKIQLLTIGTGFDVELTAKENVYLNGAIIGYSRRFIDEHYDEIVEFAELQDFMDEKVKNFSSGMVSRLGFAIATMANAAEILILDEVLAVGDEFFRKKSLGRVKEMIHSGSTVLIVSHNMSTILENCSKVIWLEKSKLKMIGDTKIVCREYSLQGQK